MLKTAGLSKTFKNAAEPALSDINLEIEEGEFICIVGPSGCGKSTLLNLIAGLEKPTEGTITLDGREVLGPGADRVVMFQEPALYPWLNVIDNVKFGMKLAGVPKGEQEKRAEKYLKMVHLWDFREYAVHELSGEVVPYAGFEAQYKCLMTDFYDLFDALRNFRHTEYIIPVTDVIYDKNTVYAAPLLLIKFVQANLQ